jgi:hypothetical protein
VNPPELLPDDEGAEQIEENAGDDGLVTLQRYFVAVNVLEPDGTEWVYTATRHYASPILARLELPAIQAEYPQAGIVSAVLAFDPADAEQMRRYERFRAEGMQPWLRRRLS